MNTWPYTTYFTYWMDGWTKESWLFLKTFSVPNKMVYSTRKALYFWSFLPPSTPFKTYFQIKLKAKPTPQWLKKWWLHQWKWQLSLAPTDQIERVVYIFWGQWSRICNHMSNFELKPYLTAHLPIFPGHSLNCGSDFEELQYFLINRVEVMLWD